MQPFFSTPPRRGRDAEDIVLRAFSPLRFIPFFSPCGATKQCQGLVEPKQGCHGRSSAASGVIRRGENEENMGHIAALLCYRSKKHSSSAA